MTPTKKKKQRAPESIETEDTRGQQQEGEGIDARGELRFVISTVTSLTSIPLESDKTYVIGREEDADIAVNDASVSRRHASLVIETASSASNEKVAVRIRDLGSRNGSRIARAMLPPNQDAVIALGVAFTVGNATLIAHRAPAGTNASNALPAVAANTKHVVVAKSMVDLYAMLDVIARTELTVLVLGETGTGKELIAEHIHERSGRKGPLLTINCAALPESILEAELFGFERGAFTGANAAKIGLLESAHEGTLFMDEVGELPLPVQAKLLRFLEQREVVRLGSVRARTVDVRVVAATHRDLREDIAAGAFRNDLYFRLDGITAHIPPLRERREEVFPLATRFAEKTAAAIGKPTPAISARAATALARHPFPGNVRELKSAIERAVVLAYGRPAGRDGGSGTVRAPVIEVDHLMLQEALPQQQPPPQQLTAQIHALERTRIIEALESCEGNQSKAAKRLGISRHTLMSRMDDFGLARPKKK